MPGKGRPEGGIGWTPAQRRAMRKAEQDAIRERQAASILARTCCKCGVQATVFVISSVRELTAQGAIRTKQVTINDYCMEHQPR